jgi:hypothetical protein
VPIKTAIWVSGHLRRCFANGLSGVVARHGADDAGAVLVRVIARTGEVRLYGPAPGPAFDDIGRRRFRSMTDGAADAATVEAIVRRELSFDPDLWVIDIDDDRGEGLLDAIER